MDEFTRQFYDLEMTLLKPEVRSSLSLLDTLLADDFTEFGSSGAVYRKTDTLLKLTTSADKIVFEMLDFRAQKLSPDIVFTTFKTKRTTNDTLVVTSLRSSIWKHDKEGWRMFFHQGTPTSLN